jgi:protein-L-isoaspartate(D-aspartate) O-methyltransferase
MVERDLRGRGIKDARVLEAMSSVPRHLFVEAKLHRFAYDDRPLPIGERQTISQPYMVALMTQLLGLKGDERVLEIGTGSGYQAAVLAHVAQEVYTVEIIAPLANRAKERLGQLGYSNVWIKIGDGFFGWKENAPFDAILLTAAAEKIPEPLWAQLRERGVMIMPLGPERQNQRLVRVRKISGEQRIEEITGVMFVPMTGTVEKESR